MKIQSIRLCDIALPSPTLLLFVFTPFSLDDPMKLAISAHRTIFGRFLWILLFCTENCYSLQEIFAFDITSRK